jgi:hypothetical protein
MTRTYILSLFVLFYSLSMGTHAHAVTSSPAPSPTAQATSSATPAGDDDSSLNKTVQSLKDKIEDKVEQMNKKSKKIVKGYISSIKDSTIQIKSESDVSYTITLDDTITTIQSASVSDQDELEQSDLVKDDYILVSGPIIENQISANLIYVQTQYIVIQGQITSINRESFTIDVLTLDKDSYTLDIDDKTKQVLMNSKTLALEKSGFSKFQVGDNIHAVLIKPKGEVKTVQTIRTLIIPQEYFTSL